MEYRSCIKNELGEIVWWCDEHTDKEITECLERHPEWYLSGEAMIIE